MANKNNNSKGNKGKGKKHQRTNRQRQPTGDGDGASNSISSWLKKNGKDTTPDNTDFDDEDQLNEKRNGERNGGWGGSKPDQEEWSDAESYSESDEDDRKLNVRKNRNDNSMESEWEDADSQSEHEHEDIEVREYNSRRCESNQPRHSNQSFYRGLNSNHDNETNQELNDALQRLQSCEDRIKLLSKIIVKQDEMIKSLKKRVVKNEAKAIKSNLIVSGLIEDKTENAMQKVGDFFKEALKIEMTIEIKSAHRMGKAVKTENRNLLVELVNVTDKGVIFKHVKNLKGKEQYKEVYINDHLPEELAEEQRRKKQIIRYNKTLLDSQQQDIEWNKGELVIDGKQYRPKVAEPTVREVIDMSNNKEDMKRILSCRLTEGKTVTKMRNKFTAYVASVYSITDVTDCYKQLVYRFPDASHIMCAYRILDPDLAHMQDAVDHGEIGAGRRMIDMMNEKEFNNKAVFVIRIHSGMNIGPTRFKIINEVAESALNAIPEGLESRLRREGVIGITNFSLYRKEARIGYRKTTKQTGQDSRPKQAESRQRGSSVAEEVPLT